GMIHPGRSEPLPSDQTRMLKPRGRHVNQDAQTNLLVEPPVREQPCAPPRTPGATFSDRSRQSVVERSRHGTTTNDRSLTLERFLLPHFVLARYTPLTPRPTHPELAPRRTPMADQIPFGNVELASNPEPRCPCVLLVDTSASMAGTRLS